MKRLILLSTILLNAGIIFGQSCPAGSNSTMPKGEKAKEYKGWYFSPSLDIRTVPSDSAGSVGLAMLLAGKRDWDLLRKGAATKDTN